MGEADGGGGVGTDVVSDDDTAVDVNQGADGTVWITAERSVHRR